jgi:O-antigen/teichoic acid export membrane protein
MKFLRSGAIYAAANIASAAVPFLLLPLLTRVLGPAEYGSVVAFALLVTLCQTVAGLNAHAAMGVVWFQRPHGEVPAFTATALVVALASTLAVVLLVGAAFTLFPQVSDISAPWAMVAALTAGANVVLQCRLVLWQSQHRALASAALQFGTSALNVGLSLLAVLAFAWGGDGRNAGIAAATVVMAFVAVALFAGAGELRWAPSAEQRSTLLRFGAPLIVHALAGVLIGTADRWSVSVRLDAAALGVYGAGAQLGMVMSILADAFVKAYSPWLYARLRGGTPHDGRVAVGAIYAAMPTFVVLAMLVGFALHGSAVWLLGPRYQAAVGVLPWFIAGGAASGIYMCTSVLFFSHGRTARLASVTLSSALIGATLTWWLVGRFGATGAAAGFATTQGVLALLTTATAMRSFALPWREVGPAFAAWWQASFARRGALPATKTLEPGNTAP